MDYNISLYKRPNPEQMDVVEQVINITAMLTPEWFTPDVPEGIPNDLMFQDLVCIEKDHVVKSFIMFTSLDGAIHVTLMGTHPDLRHKGLGSMLMQYLLGHAAGLGFTRINLLTVPPKTKSTYDSTVRFYEKHGFIIQREIPDLWQGGALELTRQL